MQGAEDCVSNVFFTQYAAAKKTYDHYVSSSSAELLAVSALLLAFFS